MLLSYDVSVADFQRQPGETDDAPRIQRAIDAADGGVVFVPAGQYDIAETVYIKNNSSLHMHPSAVLAATEKMEYVLVYEGTPKETGTSDLYTDRTSSFSKNICLEGGEIDARGMASCMSIAGMHHITVRDMCYRNGYPYGLHTMPNSGYELIANNLYAKCNMSGLAGNTAFCLECGDSHYTDCVAVDYTIGFDLDGGSNRLTRCHAWAGILPAKEEGGVPEMLVDSINFRVKYASGNEQTLQDCYADSGYIGFDIHDNTRIIGGSYLCAPCFILDDVRVINHVGGSLLVENGFFRVTTDHGTFYRGRNQNVKWLNNWVNGNECYLPAQN